MRARPGPTVTVALTVALAVGATTSVFSVVDGVLLKPLPYPEPDRLVQVFQIKHDWLESPNSQLRSFAQRFPVAVPTFRDWSEADLGFESLGATSHAQLIHQTDTGAELIQGMSVTSGVFDVLQIPPLLGRALGPDDDQIGAPRVVVLSEGFWHERFGGDVDAVGRSLTLDSEPHVVIGVMPADFEVPTGSSRIWVPLSEEEKAETRGSQFLSVIARLADDTPLASASERLEGLQASLEETYPDDHKAVGSRIAPLLDSVVGDVRSTLWFLLGAVVLVLVIACVNIANVLSVNALARQRELAVKAAMGAGRGRLVRGLVIEGGLQAGLGGAAGILIAYGTLPLLLEVIPATLPRRADIGMNAGVLVFGLATTLLTALAVATIPALHASRTDPASMMRGSARTNTADRTGGRLRSAMVVTEVALAFMLLVGAGLLGTSFLRLWSVDRGFDAGGLVQMSAYPNPEAHPEREDRDRFLHEVADRLRGIPGVRVTAANQVPLTGSMSTTTYEVEQPDGEIAEVNVVISVILDDYFSVMSIPLVTGRDFTLRDDAEAPHVAIANRAMATSLWGEESAIGKRLRPSGSDAWTTIIGVAGDVLHQGLDVATEPKLYVPTAQNRRYPGHWILRADGDLAAVTELARDAISQASPSTPVSWTQTIEDAVAESVSVPRFRMLFAVGLSALAAVLALIGVYGVVTFAVGQRTREIGVRMALGAERSGVVREVVGSGARMALTGVAIGLLATLASSRLLSEFLFQVDPTDPVTLTFTAIAVIAVSSAASWIPARRAATIDPVTVLNSE